jgi:ribosome biogenesis GTPase
MEDLQQAIHGEIAVLAGPSGVGKSSLLNHLAGLDLVPTKEVSQKIGRGRHTTRHVELYPLDNQSWVVDTPGFSVLDMPGCAGRNCPVGFLSLTALRKRANLPTAFISRKRNAGLKTQLNKAKS